MNPAGGVTRFFVLSRQDARVREMLMMGPQDVSLEDKMLTICYGTEINPSQLNWINFAAISKDVAQVGTKNSLEKHFRRT